MPRMVGNVARLDHSGFEVPDAEEIVRIPARLGPAAASIYQPQRPACLLASGDGGRAPAYPPSPSRTSLKIDCTAATYCCGTLAAGSASWSVQLLSMLKYTPRFGIYIPPATESAWSPLKSMAPPLRYALTPSG